jgi:hypothetical protein
MVRILSREMLVNIRDDGMNRLAVVIAIAGLLVARPDPAVAQSKPDRFELGVQVSSAISSQFDRTDVGLGGRLSWHPVGLVGIESEINLYPGDFPDQRPFSRGRVEGLFGVTVGPGFDRVRPFARLRSGFLTVRDAPRPYPCILIFPPPLSCELASGRTLVAFEIGGGVEVFATRQTFVRVDAGDRLLKYPGPVFDNNRTRRDDGFFSHDFRFATGAGLRF